MTIFLRISDALIYGIKSLKRSTEDCYEKADLLKMRQYELTDSVLLQTMENFLEAAPQLMLQIYILFTESKVSNHLGEFVLVNPYVYVYL